MQLCLNHTGILCLYTGLADAMPYACSNLRTLVRGEESVTQEYSHAAVPQLHRDPISRFTRTGSNTNLGRYASKGPAHFLLIAN
jgi:hypothetical protein